MLIRTGILALGISLSLTNVTLARDSTKNYTCEGVKTLVKQRGAVVLSTKNNNVYDRFVHGRQSCELGQVLGRYSVPTRDGQCRLKVCIEFDPENDD